jgi:hypothetical protein
MSGGFGNPVRQRGKETYKLKLTNRNYNYYNGLESGKQVVGPVSAQALVEWRLGECGDKFIDITINILDFIRWTVFYLNTTFRRLDSVSVPQLIPVSGDRNYVC